MASDEVLLGVPQVTIGEEDTATDLQSMESISVTYASVTGKTRLRSINTKLLTTDTYKFIHAAIGFVPGNGGYVAGIGTVASTGKTITAGQVIRFRVDNDDFVDLGKSVAVATFMAIGSSDYFLLGFNFINPITDLTGAAFYKPTLRNPSFTEAVLITDDPDPDELLGPRDTALAMKTRTYRPTTGGVRLIHKKTKVTIKPDDAPDWQATTNCATDVQFKVLLNDPEIIVRSTGGNYVEYADSTGDTMKQGFTDLMTSAGVVTGCNPIQILKADGTIAMYYGNSDVNVEDVSEDYDKENQFALAWNLQFQGQDKLLREISTGVIELRQAA